ncbi:uncharacterized protein [Diadema antillarum]|uniref:uncharacterized protein n=1 Tax=Diadema antillarum TaxID=105358 RepID=UPI003A8BD048
MAVITVEHDEEKEEKQTQDSTALEDKVQESQPWAILTPFEECQYLPCGRQKPQRRQQDHADTSCTGRAANFAKGDHATYQKELTSSLRRPTRVTVFMNSRVKEKHVLTYMFGVLAALVILAKGSQATEVYQLNLQQGAPGNFTYKIPWPHQEHPFFTVTMLTEDQPFATRHEKHRQGFKYQDQYDRFDIDYRIVDDVLYVTVSISNVSLDDSNVYNLTVVTESDDRITRQECRESTQSV